MQPDQGDPFLNLNSPFAGWITVNATPRLCEKIWEMEKDLHSQPNLFEDLSIYGQLTFIVSMFAVHVNEAVRGTDEAWLGVVDKVLEVVEASQGGGHAHEMEHNPKQPPPTLISTMQADPSIQKRPRPRPSGPSTKSSWGIGDIARVTVDGIEREVTFASKLKDGRGRYLVMADPETRKELFGSDGETELPLPPFSTSSLVKRGSRNPVEAALLRVHAYWDLPPFQLSDLERPELADYFAQFSNIPDEGDDLSTLEKAGFKPPEYFIRRYSGPGTANPSQDEPTRTAPLSSPLNRPAPSRALATTDPSNDREITDTAPLSSPPECPEASVESKCTMAFSPSDPPFGHSAVGASDEVERVPKDHGANDAAPLLDSEELGAVEAGTGKVNDGGVGEEQEESEEEEVENVLGSKQNSAGKPKPKKKATSAKGKGKSSEGQEKTGEAILLKGAPKPRKDYGPAKRSSARLQSGPSALSPLTPTAARRTSQRAKQETNQPQAPATRRTSQRNKPDVSSAPVNQLANPSTRSRGK